jgi:hypothetical protein
MLTENVRNFHGRRINYDQARAGTRRSELSSFLAKCVVENRRNVGELDKFFKSFKFPRKVDFALYGRERYLSHVARAKYFDEIDRRVLIASAILVDPDIGLEVNSKGGREENHITYSEVELLFNLMDRNSILIIFQFIPRVKRRRYFSQIGTRLKKMLGSSKVLYISDNQVAFFLLTKDMKTQQQVMNTISAYGMAYRLITGSI